MGNNIGTLNVKQLAGYLGIGTNVAYQLVHRRDFPSIRIGKRIIIPKSQLEEWLKTNADKKLER